MKEYVIRLTNGDDLYASIKRICEEKDIKAGIIVSSVGCVYEAKIRDATGVNIQHIVENMEIISLNGTVSKNRLHLHISLSKKDLSVIGGHLVEGCKINTTCELVVLELDNYIFDKQFDDQTGYNELLIIEK